MTFEERIEAAKAVIPLAYHDVLVRGIEAFCAGDTLYVHVEGETLLTDHWVRDRDGKPNGYMKPIYLPLQPKEDT